MTAPSSRRRGPILEGPYDIAIAGGGINGVAVARDAAQRGKSVLLLEKGDFAGGTSSASSKMIHGGIRYLEQLRLGLVYEALGERSRLLRLAPHLVRPQEFLLPVYRDARRGPRTIRLGLFLYDVLSLGRRIGKSRFLSPAELLERLPHLRADGLLGGGVYHDAVMDDARLCLVNAVGAVEEGELRGVRVDVRNYTELVSHRDGSPVRLVVRDRISGCETAVLCHRLVRALGPWAEPELLVPSKGAHVVLSALPWSEGLLLTHSRDGRVFFVVPWLGKTVVGTTETPVAGSPEEVRVEPQDVRYLLEELRRMLPGLEVDGSEILGAFAGVRPLARRGGLLSSVGPGSVSRSHRIVESGTGVVTVVGGKYTTYRAIARDVVDQLFPGTTCTTHSAPLPGGEEGDWPAFRTSAAELVRAHGEAVIARLYRRYGCRLRAVCALIEADPTLAEPLAPECGVLRAEAVHAVRDEFVVYPEDFIDRRTTLRYGAGGQAATYAAVEEIIRRHAATVPADLDAARLAYERRLEHENALRNDGSEASARTAGDDARSGR